MITEIAISHYKSISEMVLKFGDINVIVGKNGSGKSNIVDALAFVSDVANEDLDYAMTRRHGADSVRQWNKYKPFHTSIAVRISNNEGKGLYKLSFASSKNSYRVIEEIIEWEGELSYSSDVHKTSIKRSLGKSLDISSDYAEGDIDFENISQMKIDSHEAMISRITNRYTNLHWLIGVVPRELRSLSTFNIFPNTIRAPQTVSRGNILEQDGRNIASIIKQLSSERRRRIVKSLSVVLPLLQNITVKSAANYYVPVMLVAGQSDGDGHELNMSQVSDGTLRILGMLTALFQFNAPSKVVLEEPEQMVHPALLLVIKDAIMEYLRSNEGGQVFLTTHSAVLLDLFDLNNVIAVEYTAGSSRAGPISKRQKKIVRDGLMTLGDVLLAEDLEIA